MNIILADDHCLALVGMRALVSSVERDVQVREALSLTGLRLELQKQSPQLLVLSLTMSDASFIKELRASYPDLPILAMGTHDDPQGGARVLQLGVQGFLTRRCSHDEFLLAVRTLLQGGTYCPPNVKVQLFDSLVTGDRDPINRLSEREQEVLSGLANGRSLTQLAASMMLSVKTVSTYRTRLMNKLGLKNDAELFHFAHKAGLSN